LLVAVCGGRAGIDAVQDAQQYDGALIERALVCAGEQLDERQGCEQGDAGIDGLAWDPDGAAAD